MFFFYYLRNSKASFIILYFITEDSTFSAAAKQITLSPPLKKTEVGEKAEADFFVLIFESLIAAEFTVSFRSLPFRLFFFQCCLISGTHTQKSYFMFS